MKIVVVRSVILIMTLGAGSIFPAQSVVTSATPVSASSQTRELLGLKLRPEILAIVKEIETKTRKSIYADFDEQPEFQIGASYIDEKSGQAIITVDTALEDDPKKLEAVLVHELLHLRLTANGYPGFIWSPKVRTAKGMAIDVEQSNINDLRSIIEHRVFKAEMIKFDLYKYIDLAGVTLEDAKQRKGDEAGQADVINMVRAILEYTDPKDIAAVRQAFNVNGWQSTVKDANDIAAIINQTPVNTPKDVEAVFLRCIAKLYPVPRATWAFTLKLDPANKYFRRMIVNFGPVAKKMNLAAKYARMMRQSD